MEVVWSNVGSTRFFCVHTQNSELADDDGHLVVCYVHETQPRAELLRLALGMKKGKMLAEHRSVTALRVREFKLAPHDGLGDVPYIVDGEAMAAGAIHVRVLPRRLKVFGPANQGVAVGALAESAVSLSRIEAIEAADSSEV
jgi:diacylglycerol kinase family enzyme